MTVLEKFYFTFGSSEIYPFQGGWVTIYAKDKREAIKAFMSKYPNRPGSDCFNASDCYQEEEFKSIELFNSGNLGKFNHKTFIVID